MSPDERLLTDRVAIITGGGRGLGRAMAAGLTQSGCRVVITAAREAQQIDAVASEIGGDRVLAITADVTREEDCARVVEATLARFAP
jgi:NAD(P)-dependent dehydrogenase (short-subunit alcohol dehydrogenase family)